MKSAQAFSHTQPLARPWFDRHARVLGNRTNKSPATRLMTRDIFRVTLTSRPIHSAVDATLNRCRNIYRATKPAKNVKLHRVTQARVCG